MLDNSLRLQTRKYKGENKMARTEYKKEHEFGGEIKTKLEVVDGSENEVEVFLEDFYLVINTKNKTVKLCDYCS